MFDRFILASSYKRITERFNMCYISDSNLYMPSFNIAVGQLILRNPKLSTETQFKIYYGANYGANKKDPLIKIFICF